MDYFDYEIIHTLKNQWDSYISYLCWVKSMHSREIRNNTKYPMEERGCWVLKPRTAAR